MSLRSSIIAFFVQPEPLHAEDKKKSAKMKEWYSYIVSKINTAITQDDFKMIENLLERYNLDYKTMPGHTEDLKNLERFNIDRKLKIRIRLRYDDEMRNHK